MKTQVSHSLEETAQIASKWLAEVSGRYPDSDEAVVVGLSGHLGAGKTAFVKEVAKQLGVKEEVTSPTFVIMKLYEIKHPRWRRLVHIDAYRLERREELEALDWERLVSDPYSLVIIEWPENVALKDSDLKAGLKFDIEEGEYHISF